METKTKQLQNCNTPTDLLRACITHIQELGAIIRYLDEDNVYNEYWLQDGLPDGYTSFTESINKQISSNDRTALRLGFIMETILRDKHMLAAMSYRELCEWYGKNIDDRIEKEAHYLETLIDMKRINNAIIAASLLRKHAGKILIIYDQEYHTAAGIIRAVTDCYNWHAQHDKPCHGLDPKTLLNSERVYLPCNAEWHYTATATAVLSDTQRLSIGSDGDYVLLRAPGIVAYNGRGISGFVGIVANLYFPEH